MKTFARMTHAIPRKSKKPSIMDAWDSYFQLFENETGQEIIDLDLEGALEKAKKQNAKSLEEEEMKKEILEEFYRSDMNDLAFNFTFYNRLDALPMTQSRMIRKTIMDRVEGNWWTEIENNRFWYFAEKFKRAPALLESWQYRRMKKYAFENSINLKDL